MPRDPVVIRAEWDAAQLAYHEAAQSQPEKVWRPLSARVKSLREEYIAALTDGCVPCSRCGAKPIGLRHVRGSVSRSLDATFRHVYEIGCVNCFDGNQSVTTNGQTKVVHDDRRGFGETPARAMGPELDEFAAKAVADAQAAWNQKNAR